MRSSACSEADFRARQQRWARHLSIDPREDLDCMMINYLIRFEILYGSRAALREAHDLMRH
jgi:hypothetical protein